MATRVGRHKSDDAGIEELLSIVYPDANLAYGRVLGGRGTFPVAALAAVV